MSKKTARNSLSGLLGASLSWSSRAQHDRALGAIPKRSDIDADASDSMQAGAPHES